MPDPIYINDFAVMNVLGNNKQEVAKALLATVSPLVPYNKLFSGRQTYVGKVHCQLNALPQEYHSIDCHNNRMLFKAFQEIKPVYDKLTKNVDRHRIAVILGTSTSGILEGERSFAHYVKTGVMHTDFHYHQQEFGTMAEFISELANAKGPRYVISTACSSSGKAFLSAKRLIDSGLCDICIVGGADSLSELPLNGFDALDSVAKDICQPFGQDRDGINIGEGAALFVLSKTPANLAFLGGGETSDAYHITSPDPAGVGAKQAMLNALKDANLNPDDIAYINAHGTATPKNDQMESKAIFEVFGKKVLCSSTKPLTGHTLGAASATELALCALLLSKEYNPEHRLPAQISTSEFDHELPKIQLTNEQSMWQKPYFLSNSFAFGGNNVSLIIADTDKKG
ncbi:beta-ketoacyl-ACP synthase [Cysteiniphilum halobium]|uniref:beta-ketoacyl-ACP synthase n=1 Tax=Cysteiniphilum halobium TaxID=2219059 RepID=UPI0013C2DE4C|nr:beta-ketoacyl-ACP synthase [Cysteiniphilum halobium]